MKKNGHTCVKICLNNKNMIPAVIDLRYSWRQLQLTV